MNGMPETVGRYRLIRELGRGMMGVVYLAHDPDLGRDIALKVIQLPPGASAPERASFEQRFFSEAQSAARLAHPGIVIVHDVGRDISTGALFMALQLLPGQTLDSVLKSRKRLEWPEALRIARKVAEALEHAHSEGVVHRDIKPANLFLCGNGSTAVGDFDVLAVSGNVNYGGTLTLNGAATSGSYSVVATVAGVSSAAASTTVHPVRASAWVQWPIVTPTGSSTRRVAMPDCSVAAGAAGARRRQPRAISASASRRQARCRSAASQRPTVAAVASASSPARTTVTTAAPRLRGICGGGAEAAISAGPSGRRSIDRQASPARCWLGPAVRRDGPPASARRLRASGSGRPCSPDSSRVAMPAPAASRAIAARARAVNAASGSGRPSENRTASRAGRTRRAKRAGSSAAPGATGSCSGGERWARGSPRRWSTTPSA